MASVEDQPANAVARAAARAECGRVGDRGMGDRLVPQSAGTPAPLVRFACTPLNSKLIRLVRPRSGERSHNTISAAIAKSYFIRFLFVIWNFRARVVRR